MTNTHRGLVVLGTSSGVGKTLITIAVCRRLRDRGVRVTPFKSLSMQPGAALYATPPAGAIHYHQAYQAVAAGVAPHGDLNPIALWGSVGRVSTSIRGRRMDDWLSQPPEVCTSRGRFEILDAYRQLERTHEVIVAEGCGSPVELNLKDRDVTNLWLADAVDASCVLVCSTFHGGVFASLLGTVGLMTRAERRRVLGFVVNRFDGDRRDFDSAVEILEYRSGLPCLGVVPHFADVPLADPAPADPEQVRQRVGSARLEEQIAAWTAHVSEYAALDRLLDDLLSHEAPGAARAR
ncbi:MAG TPA: AAA family ATPase [Streptosporangiaceae bacterium]|nr:AAA family ATPase [Streptosporangiaceae bacterium]